MTLQVIDYVVIALTLAISLAIGVFFVCRGSRRANRLDYLLGGRNMGMWPVALSFFVTFESAVSIMGTPSEVYNYGSLFIVIYLGLGLSYLVGYFTMVPLFYPLRLTSVYHYLELRFHSHAVRLLATVFGMIQTLLYMSIALLSPGLALEAAADIPLWLSLAVVGVVGTLYTSIGGIKSVVWTDAFQTVIVMVGILAVIIKAFIVTGFDDVFAIADNGGRLRMDAIDIDPRVRHSWWSLLLGGCATWLVNSYKQSTILRLGTLPSLKDANWAYLLSIPLNALYGGMLTLVGLGLYAYFEHIQCDPIEANLISNKNQLVPFFVVHALSNIPGLPGLFMAAIFSGTLSTLSSGINALAANTVEDLLERPMKRVSERTATTVTKLFVCVYGGLSLGLAYLARSMQGPLTQMSVSIFGACGSPILGMFLLGGCFPWASKYGALAGGLFSFVLAAWMSIGARLQGRVTSPLPPASTDKCNVTFFSNLNMTHSSHVSESTSAIFNTTHVFAYRELAETTTLLNKGLGSGNDISSGFFLYDVSYEWYGLVGLVTSLVVGVAVSYVHKCVSTKHSSKDVDPKLLIPLCRRLWSSPRRNGEADDRDLDILPNFAGKYVSEEEKGASLLLGEKQNHRK